MEVCETTVSTGPRCPIPASMPWSRGWASAGLWQVSSWLSPGLRLLWEVGVGETPHFHHRRHRGSSESVGPQQGGASRWIINQPEPWEV